MSVLTEKDPRDVVKAGDIVRVKVMEVDEARKRIGLSMRLNDKAGDHAGKRENQGRGPRPDRNRQQPRENKQPSNTALAAAFANARQK